jgi:hypothetical protein
MTKKEVMQLFEYMRKMEGKKFSFRDTTPEDMDFLINCWTRLLKNINKEIVISAYENLLISDDGKYGITPADILRVINTNQRGTQEDWKAEAELQFETALNDYCRYRDTSNLSENAMITFDNLGGIKKLSTLKVGYETDQFRKRFIEQYTMNIDRNICHAITHNDTILIGE